ncbi:hypothetical protein WKI68_37845 [Streptomyces sp. MS1.HAVA.3]|uniref:Uncharacterized protein n=1 Tax=Streptomyces caledonius TaxID=3134107 RepID=A0ABU8UC36_9ACTN
MTDVGLDREHERVLGAAVEVRHSHRVLPAQHGGTQPVRAVDDPHGGAVHEQRRQRPVGVREGLGVALVHLDGAGESAASSAPTGTSTGTLTGTSTALSGVCDAFLAFGLPMKFTSLRALGASGAARFVGPGEEIT